MLQITKEGRALVRSATGVKAYRPDAPGVLREWHWKAMVEAWKARPAGVKDENSYDGHIGWNTWLHLGGLQRWRIGRRISNRWAIPGAR